MTLAGSLNRRLLIILQDEVSKGCRHNLKDDGHHEFLTFSGHDDWREKLRVADEIIAHGNGTQAVVFVSIQVANYIRRSCPSLRHYLNYDPEVLAYNRISNLLPAELYLNQTFLMLPFGTLPGRRDQLRAIFGDRLFLRPNDSRKPFAGFTFPLEDLDHEINALRQISNIRDAELCIIDRERAISKSEFRFWIADGRILTLAGYSHDGTCSDVCPASVYALAERTAKLLDQDFGPVVADFVEDEHGLPRLIEFNCVSTSGFYLGMDLGELIDGLVPWVTSVDLRK